MSPSWISFELKVPKPLEKEVHISQANLYNSRRLRNPSRLLSEVWQPPDGLVHIYVTLPSAPKQYELWCVIENKSIPFSITVPTTKVVDHLQELIHQKAMCRDVSTLDLILIELKVPKPFEKEVYISQADSDNSPRLDLRQLISEVWQMQPPNGHVHIYVMLYAPASQDIL